MLINVNQPTLSEICPNYNKPSSTYIDAASLFIYDLFNRPANMSCVTNIVGQVKIDFKILETKSMWPSETQCLPEHKIYLSSLVHVYAPIMVIANAIEPMKSKCKKYKNKKSFMKVNSRETSVKVYKLVNIKYCNAYWNTLDVLHKK